MDADAIEMGMFSAREERLGTQQLLKRERERERERQIESPIALGWEWNSADIQHRVVW